MVKIGHQLLYYDLSKIFTQYTKPNSVIDLRSNFEKLQYLPFGPRSFGAIPYLYKQVREFKIKSWTEIVLNTVSNIDHNVRRIGLYSSPRWITMSGMDGAVSIRANVNSPPILSFNTHHYRDLGVKKALMTDDGQTLLSLGFDGSVVAINHFFNTRKMYCDEKLVHHANLHIFGRCDIHDYQSEVNALSKLLDEKVLKFSLNPVYHFFGNDEQINEQTWFDLIKSTRVSGLGNFQNLEGMFIIKNLNLIKKRMNQMLDRNNNIQDIKKLEICIFNINKKDAIRKSKESKSKCMNLQHRIEANIMFQNQISDWIRENFYNHQTVLDRSICGIYNHIEVTNYVLIEEPLNDPAHYKYAEFSHSVLLELFQISKIQIWRFQNSKDLEKMYNLQVRITESNQIVIDLLSHRKDDPEESESVSIMEGEIYSIIALYEKF